MSSLNIFIVDDNQDFAESLADLLILDGHHVELAFDGETAKGGPLDDSRRDHLFLLDQVLSTWPLS